MNESNAPLCLCPEAHIDLLLGLVLGPSFNLKTRFILPGVVLRNRKAIGTTVARKGDENDDQHKHFSRPSVSRRELEIDRLSRSCVMDHNCLWLQLDGHANASQIGRAASQRVELLAPCNIFSQVQCT